MFNYCFFTVVKIAKAYFGAGLRDPNIGEYNKKLFYVSLFDFLLKYHMKIIFENRMLNDKKSFNQSMYDKYAITKMTTIDLPVILTNRLLWSQQD